MPEALKDNGADVVVQDLSGAALMIRERAYPVEPWHVRETRLDLEVLAQAESVFALGNGHIGLRGNLDEGEPHGLPGTYLNSFYELRPLPYAEAGYGFPESGQTVVNVTNGKLIRLLVDDEPFDVRYGELVSHDRVLDLRAGTLDRELEWKTPAGRRVRVHSTRLVSFTQRAVAAIRYEVEAVDEPLRLIVQSELVANEALPAQSKDPRVAAVLTKPLQIEERLFDDTRALLIAPHQAQRAADGRGDGPRDRRAGQDRREHRVARRLGPHHDRLRAAARREAARWSSCWRTAGPAGAPCRRSATRSAARWRPRSSPAGTACAGSSGSTSTSSGTPPTCGSRATRRSSRRSGSGCSTCCRPAPARSSGRSRPRA